MVQNEFSVHAIFPNYYDATRVSYSFKSLIETMRGGGLSVQGYVFGRGPGIGSEVHALLPRTLYRHTSRWVHDPGHAIVARYAHRVRSGDIVHMWLDSPREAIVRLQSRGAIVVREMINCTAERCRRELVAAHASLGWDYTSPMTDAAIERERGQLLAADAVFCPNDEVMASVLAYGVPPERCIKTSYGWSPERLAGTSLAAPRTDGTQFLFVGTGDVRKGLPWLLQAWVRAGVHGRLLLAGSIDPRVRAEYADVLARDDVVLLGHVADVGAAYRSADVFCFPSWEEGGPMVTIEAMGMGLPCIVTAMGSAGILSASSGGAIVVGPGDIEAMAAAMWRLGEHPAERQRLAEESLRIASDYVWARVGLRRADALRKLRAERLGAVPTGTPVAPARRGAVTDSSSVF